MKLLLLNLQGYSKDLQAQIADRYPVTTELLVVTESVPSYEIENRAYNSYSGWYETGTNHRTEGDRAVRDVSRPMSVIDLTHGDGLTDLLRWCGPLCLYKRDGIDRATYPYPVIDLGHLCE